VKIRNIGLLLLLIFIAYQPVLSVMAQGDPEPWECECNNGVIIENPRPQDQWFFEYDQFCSNVCSLSGGFTPLPMTDAIVINNTESDLIRCSYNNGDWNLTELGDRACMLDPYPPPGPRANEYFPVIAMHAWLSRSVVGPGIVLRDLRLGDEFVIHYEDIQYRYIVVGRHIVEPEDMWVLIPSADRLDVDLVVFTCHGRPTGLLDAEFRLVIDAQLMD